MNGLLMATMFTMMAVPQEIDTSFKSYMDYRTITNVDSEQYKLQQISQTDENGLRMYDGYYLVAMGSHYGTVGDCFKITLDTEEVIYVMIGDVKADKDTDCFNMYYPMEGDKGNVIEFIVDVDELPKTAKLMGDISYVDEVFEGNVWKIQLIPQERSDLYRTRKNFRE